MKKLFLKEELSIFYEDENSLKKDYKEIVGNTVRLPFPLSSLVLETSNTLLDVPEQISLDEYAEGSEVQDWENTKSNDPNIELPNTNFLCGENGLHVPSNVDSETVNLINTSTCLWGVIPKDIDGFNSTLKEINYLNPDKLKKILKTTEYTNLPLMENAAINVVDKKIGKGKSISSALRLKNGSLKREISDLSVVLSGGNIDSNKDGFFKVTFGVGSAYLTNFKDFYADEATDVLIDNLKSNGYNDITFVDGELETFTYFARYSSEKLGVELLKESGLDGFDPLAIIEFRTSDFGKSSINITPTLEFSQLTGVLGFPRRFRLTLSSMLALSHDSNTEEKSLKTQWEEKCQEIYAVVKEATSALVKAETKKITNVSESLKKVKEFLNIPYSQEILELEQEFLDFYGAGTDQRNLFVYVFQMLNAWSETNKVAALTAKEKLCRLLFNGKLSDFTV